MDFAARQTAIQPCNTWQDEEEEDGGIIGNGVKPEAEGARGISRNKIKFEGAAAISPTAKR